MFKHRWPHLVLWGGMVVRLVAVVNRTGTLLGNQPGEAAERGLAHVRFVIGEKRNEDIDDTWRS